LNFDPDKEALQKTVKIAPETTIGPTSMETNNQGKKRTTMHLQHFVAIFDAARTEGMKNLTAIKR
jgi:hypothetical protein